jgi:hypothetical protein
MRCWCGVDNLGEGEDSMNRLVVGEDDFGSAREVGDLSGGLWRARGCWRECNLWGEEVRWVCVRSEENPIRVAWYPFPARLSARP